MSDVPASKDWYVRVLGFESRLEEEIEAAVVGAVLTHRSGVVLGLHLDAERAAALSGFAPIGLTVENRERLRQWIEWCDGWGVAHDEIAAGHLGSYVDIFDPDGIGVRLHSAEQLNVDEA